MSDHYSMDLFPDDKGWFIAECNCGWKSGGRYPSAEDACDALMDHAYEAGAADAAERARAGEWVEDMAGRQHPVSSPGTRLGEMVAKTLPADDPHTLVARAVESTVSLCGDPCPEAPDLDSCLLREGHGGEWHQNRSSSWPVSNPASEPEAS